MGAARVAGTIAAAITSADVTGIIPLPSAAVLSGVFRCGVPDNW